MGSAQRDVLRLDLDEMPDPLPIERLGSAFRLSLRPPGSKSLTNRAVLMAALGGGESILTNALTSAEDARVMLAAVERLGARVASAGRHLRIEGVGGLWEPDPPEPVLMMRNAGTATRFLAAAALLSDPTCGPITIDGGERMRERPIGQLVASLRRLGAHVDFLGTEGFCPIRISPPEHLGGYADGITMPPVASSQFISAVLMAGAFLPRGLAVSFEGPVTSAPYVEMTVRFLRRLGVMVEGEVTHTGPDGRVLHGPLRVHPASLDVGPGEVGDAIGLLEPFEYDVEPDASGATYLWAVAALVDGARMEVPGITGASLQGDARFVDCLEAMGARVERSEESTTVEGTGELRGIDIDLRDMPDAAMTLASVSAFADGPTTIRGLHTLRHKECDRIAATRTELERVGVGVEVLGEGTDDEGLVITPPLGGLDESDDVEPVTFRTYDDHRMAMAMSLIGLRRPNCSIADPKCVRKTYPEYWGHLARLYE